MKDKNWVKNWLIYFSIMTLFSLAVLFVTFTDIQNPFFMKMKYAVIVAVFLIIVLSILMFISVFVKHKRDPGEEEDEQTK